MHFFLITSQNASLTRMIKSGRVTNSGRKGLNSSLFLPLTEWWIINPGSLQNHRKSPLWKQERLNHLFVKEKPEKDKLV